jgi:multicomponent Na+:H+ antiporter subunit E
MGAAFGGVTAGGGATRVSLIGGAGSAPSIDRAPRLAERWRRVLALAPWAGATWVVLSWTATVEQAVYGTVAALLASVALAPLGPVARPWKLADPRRLARVVAVAATSLVRIVSANVELARRVWSPSLPIRTGMLVIPTDMRSDGAVFTVGVLGSVIVDHQLVDLEPGRLQYHALWVASEDPEEARERINGPVERLIRPLDEAAVDG